MRTKKQYIKGYFSGRKALKAFTSLLMIPFIFAGSAVFQGCEKDVAVFSAESELNASAKAPKQKKAVDLKLIADNMVAPIGLVPSPDDTERLFVIDQIGKFG